MHDSLTIPYIFFAAMSALLGFFLIRFWFSVDEIRKDVKSLLITQAKRNEMIENIKEDIDELKENQLSLQRKMNHMEIEIQKLKH